MSHQGLAFQLSSTSPLVRMSDLRHLAGAFSLAAAEVAMAWGLLLPTVTAVEHGAPAHGDAVRITFVSQLDLAGAAAYHSTDPANVPYCRVLVSETVAPATWQRAASHEMFETLVDPQCNRWASDGSGRMWALEICDPVQDIVHEIDAGGDSVAISDWCTPAWFVDRAFGMNESPCVDAARHVDAPWTIAPGGYALTVAGGRHVTLPERVDAPVSGRSLHRIAVMTKQGQARQVNDAG